MIFIDNVLVSEEVISQRFVCNLKACKGACCWEGDYGAPLNEDEVINIDIYKEVIASQLGVESQKYLDSNSGYEYIEDADTNATSCHPDGSCVFLKYSESGMATCGIENAHRDGVIPFNKPISCHMYPIRVTKNEEQGFEAWNYDEWDICSAACTLGEELKVPVYQFLKEPIIRYKGEEFYEGLEQAISLK